MSITNKMVKGAAWMVALKIVERSIGMVSTIILARLLVPSDFGLVAMATTFLSLLMLLTEFSFDVALIQNQQADRRLYDTAWTFNVIFGFLLAVLLISMAIPLSAFYNEQRLEKILYVLAVSTLLSGFSNIGPVAFRKDLEFHKEFLFQISKKLSSFSVCMILAFTLKSYWALVFGTFTGRIIEVFLSYRAHPYRPRFCLAARGELFRFSMWLFVNNSLYFTYNRLADFVVSKLLGNHVLGIYSVAYEIANLPTTELVAPINRAVFPGYSKIANEPGVIRQGFTNVLSVIALFAIPASFGIAAVAEPLVYVLLGEKWLETIPLIRIFAFSGLLTALQTNASVIYNAIGKPRYMTKILLIHILLLFLPSLFVLLPLHGITGVAEAYLLSALIIFPINYAVVKYLIHIRWRDVLGALWRPVFGGTAMYFAVQDFLQLNPADHSAPQLLTAIALGGTVYCIITLLLWQLVRRPAGAELFLFSRLQQRFAR